MAASCHQKITERQQVVTPAALEPIAYHRAREPAAGR
jgi:hypothetical protein